MDGRMDRQTDRIAVASTVLAIPALLAFASAACCKKMTPEFTGRVGHQCI